MRIHFRGCGRGAAIAALLAQVTLGAVGVQAAAAAVLVDGLLDSSFATNGIAKVTNAETFVQGSAVALDSAGRPVVAGTARVGGNAGIFLARYTTSGALDSTFGVSGVRSTQRAAVALTVSDVAMDSTGRIVVGGKTDAATPGFFVARYSATGTLDDGFGDHGLVIDTSQYITGLSSIAVDSVDRIVVAGTIDPGTGLIARYSSTGAPDTSFSGDGKVTIAGLAGAGMTVDPADRVLVVGSGRIGRVTASGVPDSSFGTGGSRSVYGGVDAPTEIVLSGTDIVAAGSEWRAGQHVITATRYSDAGVPDTTFGASGFVTASLAGSNFDVHDLIADSDGRLVVTSTINYQGENGLALLRLVADGTPDPGFGGYGDGFAVVFDDSTPYPAQLYGVAAAVDGLDRVLVTGTQYEYAGSSALLARLGPATTPGAPTALRTIGFGGGSVNFGWTAPLDDGGTPILGYSVTVTPGGQSCVASAPYTGCGVSGLTNGVDYTVTVQAINAAGVSPSAALTWKLLWTPDAPTGVTAAAATGAVTVSWVAPADTGGSPITAYTVSESPGGGTCATAGGLTCSVAVGAGAHSFTVRATNAQGIGAASPAASTTVAPPAAPTGVVAVLSAGTATVSWSPSASAGSPPALTYDVAASPALSTCRKVAGANACTVTGLAAGTSYTFRVTAHNAFGSAESEPSNAVVVPPLAVVPPPPPPTVPGAPAFVVGVRGDRQINVSWATASSGGSAITAYTAVASPGGATCASSATSCTVTGLVNGTGYTFTVRATNAVGSGAASTPSLPVVPATTPGASPRISGARGHLSAVVTWAAPANGGAAITGYRVQASPGGRSCTTTGAPRCTVTGLVTGRAYRFTVTATNAVGPGRASVASAAVTPAPVPGVPTRVVAARGNGRVTVSFTAPVANGTSPITGYRVVASPGGATCTATQVLRCAIAGLLNGRSYAFSVVAINRIGASPGSVAVSATPATTPTPVRALVAAFPAAGRTVVSWLAPASAGGLPLVRYEYRTSADNGRTWTRWTSNGLSRSTQITGWATGRTYLIDVIARTGAGASTPTRLAARPTR